MGLAASERVTGPTGMAAPPRPLLYYGAVVVQLLASALSGVGFVLQTPVYFLAGSGVWVVWFGIMFLMARRDAAPMLARHGTALRRGAATIFTVLFLTGVLEIIAMAAIYPAYFADDESPGDFGQALTGLRDSFRYSDSAILVQQAAENMLDGKNPYTHANIVEGLIRFNGAYDRVTPLRAGSFTDVFPYPSPEQLKVIWDAAVLTPDAVPPELETQIGYPAGSFLLPAPFIAIGITDIRIAYAILALAGMGYALWRIPGKRRLVFIGGVLISLEFWNSVAAGETGIVCFPLLMVAWLSLDRNRWLSLVFMGLAVASKQTAWFIVPFYLILLQRTYGWKTVGAGIGILAGVFALLNLPFIFMDPGAWLTSVASPMTDPMFPIGVGLVTLVTTGLVNIQTALPFTVLELLAMAAGMVWYWRNCRRHPNTGLLLAVLPLMFAWRSLWTYFFYVGIITFAAVLMERTTSSRTYNSE